MMQVQPRRSSRIAGLANWYNAHPYTVRAAKLVGKYAYNNRNQIMKGVKRGGGIIKKTFKKKPPRDKTERANEAEADVGYGQHEARSVYIKRKRGKRSNRRKTFKRRMNKSFKKKVNQSLSAKYPYQDTYFNSLAEIQSLINCIGALCISLGSGCLGYNTGGEQNNDLNTISRQLETSTQFQAVQTKKFFLRKMSINMIVRNAAAVPAMIKMYECSFKQNIPNAALAEADINNLETVQNIRDLLHLCYASYDTSVQETDNSTTGVVTKMTSTTPGYSPTSNPNFRKYCSIDKIESFELASNASIDLTRSYYVNKEFKCLKIEDVGFFKDVSRFWIFESRGIPTLTVMTPAFATTACPVVHSIRRYQWRLIDDSYETTDGVKSANILWAGSQLLLGNGVTTRTALASV